MCFCRCLIKLNSYCATYQKCLTWNGGGKKKKTIQMREIREEWPEWFELIGSLR